MYFRVYTCSYMLFMTLRKVPDLDGEDSWNWGRFYPLPFLSPKPQPWAQPPHPPLGSFQFEKSGFLAFCPFKSILSTHPWTLRGTFCLQCLCVSPHIHSWTSWFSAFSFLFMSQLGAVAVFFWSSLIYLFFTQSESLSLQVWWMCMYVIDSFSLLGRLLSQHWPEKLVKSHLSCRNLN